MSAEVFVRGLGAVSAAGIGVGALKTSLADPGFAPDDALERDGASPLPVVLCRGFDPREHLPPLVARRLDRPARLLAVAAREALGGATAVPPWDRERIAVTAGTWNAGTASLIEVLRTTFLTSPEEAPPTHFPSTVANAPASQLGILEKLGGPNLTFFEKQVGGLRALTEGARLLRRGRADAVLACGVDEAQWLNAEGYDRLATLRRNDRPGMLLAEGAAVILLTCEPAADALAKLAGFGAWAVPSTTYLYPDTAEPILRAAEQALAAAGLVPDDVDLVVAMSNGLVELDRLELDSFRAVFGAHRPVVVAPTLRFGEGAYAGVLRTVIAAMAVSGPLDLAWRPPPHLAAVSRPADADRARVAMVWALAGGGSALAAVLTSP